MIRRYFQMEHSKVLAPGGQKSSVGYMLLLLLLLSRFSHVRLCVIP